MEIKDTIEAGAAVEKTGGSAELDAARARSAELEAAKATEPKQDAPAAPTAPARRGWMADVLDVDEELRS
jgi:hypothetical protein